MADNKNNLQLFLNYLEKNKSVKINTLTMQPYQGMNPRDIKKSMRAYKMVFQMWDKYTYMGKQAKQEYKNKGRLS